MNYDEITKITAERISDYMTEAVNTDSKAVAEMFYNAAWGVRSLWFELVTKIEVQIHYCILFSLKYLGAAPMCYDSLRIIPHITFTKIDTCENNNNFDLININDS